MGHYSGVEDAKVISKLPKIEAGRYVLKVLKYKMIETRKKEAMLIQEFEVVQSTNPNRPVGVKISLIPLPVRLDAFQSTVKGFLAPLYKQPDDKITEAVCEMSEDKDVRDPTTGAIVEKPGATRNRLVRADANWGKLKDQVTDFLFVTYMPYNETDAPLVLGAAIPAPATSQQRAPAQLPPQAPAPYYPPQQGPPQAALPPGYQPAGFPPQAPQAPVPFNPGAPPPNPNGIPF